MFIGSSTSGSPSGESSLNIPNQGQQWIPRWGKGRHREAKGGERTIENKAASSGVKGAWWRPRASQWPPTKSQRSPCDSECLPRRLSTKTPDQPRQRRPAIHLLRHNSAYTFYLAASSHPWRNSEKIVVSVCSWNGAAGPHLQVGRVAGGRQPCLHKASQALREWGWASAPTGYAISVLMFQVA
jgi:hypothetical protein